MSATGGVEQLRRDGVHPDPERAQLQVEHAGEVDQGRLADGVGGHPGGRLQARAGGHVHDRTRTAFPQVRNHRLGQPQRRADVDVDHEPQVFGRCRERFAQVVHADGVHQHLRRADLGGDPVDDAPGRGRVGRVGRLASDAVRQLLQPFLAPVDPDHCEPGGRQPLRRRTAELTARADHDRYTLTHAVTSVEAAPKTDVMAFLLPVMNRPDRSGRVQVPHREGEWSSPDSGDLQAIYAGQADRVPAGPAAGRPPSTSIVPVVGASIPVARPSRVVFRSAERSIGPNGTACVPPYRNPSLPTAKRPLWPPAGDRVSAQLAHPGWPR